jgi:plasmid stabilization system protein ParE
MARVELLPGVLDDLDRIFDHLAKHDVEGAPDRIAEMLNALDVLTTSPQIGRPARQEKRELVIGSGSRGYVALYRYSPEVDAVFVLAIRSQKEAGYRR